jgi:rhodanese-related sulfurtransferase
MNGSTIQSITVQELHALAQQRPVEIIDVRTPEEFREVRATGVRHVPMDQLDPQQVVQSRTLDSLEPLYFICHLGGRSGRVCMAMIAAGYSNVVNVTGGTEAWEEAGLPVQRG